MKAENPFPRGQYFKSIPFKASDGMKTCPTSGTTGVPKSLNFGGKTHQRTTQEILCNFKLLSFNSLQIISKNWHVVCNKEGNFNERNAMTLILFISACLLTFGLAELNDALKA
ncbi:MAG TPA: hypothetical protein VJ960_03700 [Oceanipulchritudo sp.]|nr:hypothetical protein [Oceanipulchritudo sp.]